MRLTRLSILATLLLCACATSRRSNHHPGGNADLAGSDLAGTPPNADGSACPNQPLCSSDLHSVLDCAGNVVGTCPTDQACSGGSCEAACQAAIDSKSSVGCEYYSLNPPPFGNSCFAAFIANTWNTPISITADYSGMSLDVSQFAYVPSGSGKNLTYTPLPGGMLAPGAVAILFLSDAGTDCPATVKIATTGDAFVGTGINNAFHLKTSAPVIAYDIFPYGGGTSAVTSATLLLPVSAWDTTYVGITAYQNTVGTDATNPWIAMVAAQDDTQITVQPTIAIAGGTGVTPAAANTSVTYTLSAGQELRLDQMGDLSGSPIVANKPIGLWGGNGCAYLPTPSIVACDGMHQQIPPVRALGNEYVGVRYRNRIATTEESPPWRIMGVVDGTTLTYDPAVTGAPTTLKKGELVEFPAAGPFDVKSQDAMHPFYLAAHMTGCGAIVADPQANCIGDPEFVNVIPPAQYLDDYVFFTDPTYPETNLVFVRSRGPSGFADVTLDCAGTLTGWMPVDSGDTYEYTRIDLSTGDFAGVGNCNNGRHEAMSSTPFTLTVWGWGSNVSIPDTSAVSYAYPAGAGLRSINPVIITIN